MRTSLGASSHSQLLNVPAQLWFAIEQAVKGVTSKGKADAVRQGLDGRIARLIAKQSHLAEAIAIL